MMNDDVTVHKTTETSYLPTPKNGRRSIDQNPLVGGLAIKIHTGWCLGRATTAIHSPRDVLSRRYLAVGHGRDTLVDHQESTEQTTWEVNLPWCKGLRVWNYSHWLTVSIVFSVGLLAVKETIKSKLGATWCSESLGATGAAGPEQGPHL